MDNRPWLVFGKHGIQIIQPAIFSPDDEGNAKAHFDRILSKLEKTDDEAAWSAFKIRCDDRRKA